MQVAELQIERIEVGTRSRKSLGDIDGLKRSIVDLGLIHPIVVTPGNRLVVGGRRLEAFKQLGRESIPAIVSDSFDEIIEALRAERDENTCREPFTPEEAVHHGRRLAEEIEKPEAARRQAEAGRHGSKGGRGKKNPSVNFSEGFDRSKNESATRVAEAVGMSRPTYEKAAAVVVAAEAEPEKYRLLVDEMNRTGKVDGAYKKLKVLKQAEELDAKPIPEPEGTFDVIVIDPPWKYGREDDPTHRSANPYPSMTVDEIKSLNVADSAEPNCILWLWTTNSHIRHAWEIIDAWGFEYKTMLTWVKDRMGTGDWLRGKTEHCLLAVRGKPTVTLTNQTTMIEGPLRKHSQKPDEFYAMVESLCPGTKMEWFSRTERKDWVGHGDESGRWQASA